MTSSFDKKNLSEDPFTLEMETHWGKGKWVLGISQRAYLEKNSKEIQYACEEDYACPIIKGNSFGIFSIPGTNVRSIERKRVPCASAVGSKISAKKNLP